MIQAGETIIIVHLEIQTEKTRRARKSTSYNIEKNSTEEWASEWRRQKWSNPDERDCLTEMCEDTAQILVGDKGFKVQTSEKGHFWTKSKWVDLGRIEWVIFYSTTAIPLPSTSCDLWPLWRLMGVCIGSCNRIRRDGINLKFRRYDLKFKLDYVNLYFKWLFWNL